MIKINIGRFRRWPRWVLPGSIRCRQMSLAKHCVMPLLFFLCHSVLAYPDRLAGADSGILRGPFHFQSAQRLDSRQRPDIWSGAEQPSLGYGP